jgi:hypothetical protein
VDQAKAIQLREKYDRSMKEIDASIERTRTQLAAAADRKPVDLDRTIEEVFLRTVSRMPTSAEFSKAKEDVAAAKDPADGIKEVLWAMLNTREFIVNH